MIRITIDEAEEIIAFIKMHEREEIPDELWEITMRLREVVYEGYCRKLP